MVLPNMSRHHPVCWGPGQNKWAEEGWVYIAYIVELEHWSFALGAPGSQAFRPRL